LKLRTIDSIIFDFKEESTGDYCTLVPVLYFRGGHSHSLVQSTHPLYYSGVASGTWRPLQVTNLQLLPQKRIFLLCQK